MQLDNKSLNRSIITPVNSLALKGIACLVIVAHHYSSYLGGAHENLVKEFFSLVCGYIAVAMFFFLSGYGLMESEKRRRLSAIAFLKRRLSRVYIPFVLTNILFIIILLCIGSYEISARNLVFQSFGFELVDSITWFVPVTLLFYFFVLLLSGLQNRLHKACGMLALCAGYVISGIILFDIPFYAYVSSPAFPLGYIASLYNKEICKFVRGIFRWILLAFSTIVFAFLSWAMMGHLSIQRHELYGVIGMNNIALLGIIVAIFAGKDYPWFHCKWLGDISYEVYLCHAKVFVVYLTIIGTFETFHPLLLFFILPIAFVVNKLDTYMVRLING